MKSDKIPSPEKACSEFLEIKVELAKLGIRAEKLKEIIKPFVAAQPDEIFVIDGWEFGLAHFEGRETFQLAKAKENLDGRTLAPYISHGSPYVQLRTTFKGGK